MEKFSIKGYRFGVWGGDKNVWVVRKYMVNKVMGVNKRDYEEKIIRNI